MCCYCSPFIDTDYENGIDTRIIDSEIYRKITTELNVSIYYYYY